jgi:protein SCO1/2
MSLLRSLRLALVAALLSVSGAAQAAPELADRMEPLPKQLTGVDVKEELGKTPGLALGFTDEQGRSVMLKDYVDGTVPVIVTFNYSNCPMLCSLQLNGVVEGLKKLSFTAGKEFRIVTISIDPAETAETARRTKARYLAQYGRPEAGAGWHFLHGSENNVRAAAKALGFSYTYVESRQEYAHPAAIALLSPQGMIARYLYGLEYPEQTLRLGLVEASQGKIGSSVDRLLLYCFHYDSSEGRYAPAARNLMRLGGGASVLALAGLVGVLVHRERKRSRSRGNPTQVPTS